MPVSRSGPLRWMRFSRAIGETRFWNVYRATLMGFACTFLLGRAGEPVRPVLIARKDSLPIPHMFGVYVLERVFDMAAAMCWRVRRCCSFERKELPTGRKAPIMRVARSAGVVLLAGLVVIVGFLIYFRFHGGAWLAGNCSTKRGGRAGARKWRCCWKDSATDCRESGTGVTWRCCSRKRRSIGYW